MTGSRVGLDVTPEEARRIQAQNAAHKLAVIVDAMNTPGGFQIEAQDTPPWLGGMEGPKHGTKHKADSSAA